MNALTSRGGGTSLAPTTMAEAMQFAEMLAESTMVPRDFQGKPANVLVAVQWGAELGLGPLQALQNIAVVNGRPSIWGDAALALVQAHPAYVGHSEWVDGEGDDRAGYCKVLRRGSAEHVARFSVADARKAGLWDKAGPWKQYPDRMLQLRARGFALRDKFADALRGVITAEEAQDLPPEEPRFVPNTATPPSRPALPEAPPAEPLPIVGPDGKLREAPNIGRWQAWMNAALSKLESREAVRAWRAENGPHLASVAALHPAEVAATEAAIETRLQEMDLAAEPAAEDAA